MGIVELKNKYLKKFVEFRATASGESEYVNSISEEKAKALVEEYESDEDKLAFVAMKGGEIVGQLFVKTMKKDSVIRISPISVLKKENGGGLAASLIKKAESVAKSKKLDEIDLVVKDDNERAIAFYVRQGYAIKSTHGKHNAIYSKTMCEKRSKAKVATETASQPNGGANTGIIYRW